jgi:hypothetical protein
LLAQLLLIPLDPLEQGILLFLVKTILDVGQNHSVLRPWRKGILLLPALQQQHLLRLPLNLVDVGVIDVVDDPLLHPLPDQVLGLTNPRGPLRLEIIQSRVSSSRVKHDLFKNLPPLIVLGGLQHGPAGQIHYRCGSLELVTLERVLEVEGREHQQVLLLCFAEALRGLS